jgi:protein-disulfide isomerase
MASKRRAAVTLPRHRATAAPAAPAAPAAQSIVVSRRSLFAVAGVAALGATGLAATGALLRRGDESPPRIAPASLDVPIAGRVKGNPAAPVTIVEYGDMQCPACAHFSLTTERELEETVIKSGLASYEFRHYAFLGKESLRAAEAVECAGEQGRFFQFRDVLYTAQRGENRGGFSDSRLKQLAQAQGLDVAQFNAAFDSGHYAERIKTQTAEAQGLGVRATPTFFINGVKLEGALPLAGFTQVIDRLGQGRAP